MVTSTTYKGISLDDFMLSPLERKEWVDGQLVEKDGMTLRHSGIEARLTRYWGNYLVSSGQGGQVYTEAPCRTTKQVRRPDVAYLTAELLSQFAESAVLPQSFPLIAEVVSPTDMAEELFTKAQEYLQSGCEEVWLLLPESRYVMTITQNQRFWFATGDIAGTQMVLQGFSVSVDELLA